ncbi:MAG: hypothetical protein AAF514_08080, partial [Verrucomicrobiota bacterium]
SIVLRFPVNPRAGDLVFETESSPNLIDWKQATEDTEFGQLDNGDRYARWLKHGKPGGDRFFRLRVVLK